MVRGTNAAPIVRPKVLAVLPNDITGCTFTRITGPLAYLKSAGYPIDWAPRQAIREMAKRHMGIGVYDIFVFPRFGDIDGRLLLMFQKLKEAGKVVIWETDDDYTNQFRQVIEADAITPMDAADAITVSVPYLRKQCMQYTDKPVYVLPNCIDLRFWDAVPKERPIGTPSVGIVGTPTHEEDWKLASEALHQIGQEYPEVQFVIGGYMPPYLRDLPNSHFIAPVQYRQYPIMIHQIDIGLCPLTDDPFNLSKSGIKALEYWAGGAAVVASDRPVYRRVMDDDRGFLASTPEEWYTAIKMYLDNPDVRNQHAAVGRLWVEENRNMEKQAYQWWQVYSDLFWNRRKP